MRIHIDHALKYHYTRSVFFEPFAIRLRPRCDNAQHVRSFELNISPEPAGRSELLDAHSNTVTRVWFDGLHDHLSLHVKATVDTRLENPFEYLLDGDDAARLPMRYPEPMNELLSVYVRRRTADAIAAELAARCLRQTRGHTLSFLTNLLDTIHHHCEKIERLDGDPWPPEKSWTRAEGACRDLALLYAEAARAAGLAARFVSGYHYTDPMPEQPQMHAWVEVYVPGGGWRAYDPSLGLVIQQQYVTVAAGAIAREAAPTLGSFRGSQAGSSLDFKLQITADS